MPPHEPPMGSDGPSDDTTAADGSEPARAADRTKAWMFDLAVVAVFSGLWLSVYGVLLGVTEVLPDMPVWLLVTTAFVTYHTLNVWLTRRTPGKALFNLAIQRIKPDGAVLPPPSGWVQQSRELIWAAMRSSVGYVVIDVAGIGMLSAWRWPGQSWHDRVFSSRVVLDHRPVNVGSVDDSPTVSQPSASKDGDGRLDRLGDHIARARAEWSQRQRLYADTKALLALWFKAATMLAGVAQWAVGHIRLIYIKLTAGGTASSSTASTVGTSTTAAMIAVPAATVVALSIAATLPAPPDPLVGQWTSTATDGVPWLQIEETAPGEFEGYMLIDDVLDNGCRFPAEMKVHELSRVGDAFYRGREPSVQAPDCRYVWGVVTFQLLDSGALRRCKRNNDEKPCDRLEKVEPAG